MNPGLNRGADNLSESQFSSLNVDEEDFNICDESIILKLGIYHEEVIILKKNLATIGFPVPGNGTDYFGPLTEQKVIEFQEYYGVTEDGPGVAGKATLNKIKEILSTPLKKGKSHPDTVQLKKDLAVLDFAVPGSGTEYYGENTEKRVKEFQNYYNLVVNGIADEPTLNKIKELLNGPMFNGLKRLDVIEFKIKLEKLGFKVSNNPTTFYGPTTEKQVRAFQEYYGITNDESGVAATPTLEKIEYLLSLPLQNGKSHPDTIQLKKDLARIGFPVPGNGTDYFGPNTEKSVKNFQKYYGLAVNGMVDEPTKDKIQKIINSPLQNGKVNKETIKLKKDLARVGFPVPGNGTDYFGPNTEKSVKGFQEFYGLIVNGIADDVTQNKIQKIINSPLQYNKSHPDTEKLKKDLAMLGYKVPGSGTEYFGENTEKRVKEFQKDYGLPVTGIADELTLRVIAEEIEKQVIKIFIDPGHGGTDPGSSGYGLIEKNIVLDIAMKTAKYLTENYRNVSVMLSRTKDEFVSLENRAKMANEWGAHYFISIHNNAFNRTANGFETYIHNKKASAEDIRYQEIIHKYLVEKLNLKDRGKKKEDFNVLRNSKMPSILIELLFIDNKNDNNLLTSNSFRDKAAKTLADAIALAFKLKKH